MHLSTTHPSTWSRSGIVFTIPCFMCHGGVNWGFNQAVNGFVDDGWAATVSDGMDDVSVMINESPTTKSSQISSESTTRNGTAGHSQLSLPLVNSSEQEEVVPLVKTFRSWQFTWNHSNKTSSLISCKRPATSSWCKYFPRHSGAFPKNIWLPVPKR
jgi:hypothetical protein